MFCVECDLSCGRGPLRSPGVYFSSVLVVVAVRGPGSGCARGCARVGPSRGGLPGSYAGAVACLTT